VGIKKSWEEGASASSASASLWRERSVERSAQGFTLVEMAIVLVIIGIIIGAVMKGQDLIDNARAKKVITTANTWNMLTWAYLDRNGRFPGDGNKDGIMGNQAAPIDEQTAATSAIGEMAALGIFTNPPDNPVSIGSYTFYIYMGFDAPGATSKNVMVICKTVNCAAAPAFTLDELKLIQAVDTAIDGISDAGLGQFRGATAVTLAGSGTENNRATAVVTAVTAVNETTAGLPTVWATTQNAAVWLFDRPY
jgi:prepilin-type N-terminal cleavage/methylation domain-containing protein